jgi:hypothetical protein
VWGLASRQALRTAVHAKGVPVTGLLLAPKARTATRSGGLRWPGFGLF